MGGVFGRVLGVGPSWEGCRVLSYVVVQVAVFEMKVGVCVRVLGYPATAALLKFGSEFFQKRIFRVLRWGSAGWSAAQSPLS